MVPAVVFSAGRAALAAAPPLDAAIVFSITALFIIPYFETIRVWFPELLRNPLLGHLIGVTVLTRAADRHAAVAEEAPIGVTSDCR